MLAISQNLTKTPSIYNTTLIENDAAYASELVNMLRWEDYRDKSNILYQIYLYKHKFQNLLSDSNLNTHERLIVEEWAYRLKELTDSLDEETVEIIYNMRKRYRIRAVVKDCLYGKQYSKQKYATNYDSSNQDLNKILFNKIGIHLILLLILSILLASGYFPKIIQYSLYKCLVLLYGTTRSANLYRSFSILISNCISGLSLYYAIASFGILAVNIEHILLPRLRDSKNMPDIAKECLEQYNKSSIRLQVENDIANADKIEVANELIKTLKNTKNKHCDEYSKQMSLVGNQEVNKYKSLYNSLSKVESDFLLLSKTS